MSRRSHFVLLALSLSMLAVGVVSWPAAAQVPEGSVVRELSASEIFVIHGGKKVFIPTQDALRGLGYTPADVMVVPNGLLAGIPRFNAPSASATPGSFLFPPDFPSAGSIDKSHYPLAVSTSQKVLSRGHLWPNGFQEMQLVEIRGWLQSPILPLAGDGAANPEGGGFDWSFTLIPDLQWLESRGVDLSKILKVGNIVVISDPVSGTTSRQLVTKPFLEVEVNSWLYRDRRPPNLSTPPADWIQLPAATWPFLPVGVEAGRYVSVFGSLVSDSGHASDARWGGEIDKWQSFPFQRPEQEEHWARWTEIHPADLIQVIDSRPRTEEVFGLTLYAGFGETRSLVVDLQPPLPKPAGNVRAAFKLIPGPETQVADANCHSIGVLRSTDSIRVTAQTCGTLLTLGRIRALVRVFWEEVPACGPANCAGCCDATGACQAGSSTAACGLGGGSCAVCRNSANATAFCAAGVCGNRCNTGFHDCGDGRCISKKIACP